MGEARRRAKQLAALIDATSAPGQPVEISAREAARRLVERTDIVLVSENETGRRVLGILANVCGAKLGWVSVTPAYDPTLPRPNVRLGEPRAGRPYPPLLVGFLLDTAEHRALLDGILRTVAARANAAVGSPPVCTFNERGPLLFIAQREVSEGAIVVLNTLQALHAGEADDLSLN